MFRVVLFRRVSFYPLINPRGNALLERPLFSILQATYITHFGREADEVPWDRLFWDLVTGRRQLWTLDTRCFMIVSRSGSYKCSLLLDYFALFRTLSAPQKGVGIFALRSLLARMGHAGFTHLRLQCLPSMCEYYTRFFGAMRTGRMGRFVDMRIELFAI